MDQICFPSLSSARARSFSFVAALAIASFVAIEGTLHAQEPRPVFDAAGFIENRAYEELAPFEHIDTLTGNVLLTFEDLVLLGDAGYDIRIHRVYNSKPAEACVGGREWDFGISGVPMRMLVPPGTPPQTDPNPEVWWPVFGTVDGARHQAIPITAHQPARSPTPSVCKKVDGTACWRSRRTCRMLRLRLFPAWRNRVSLSGQGKPVRHEWRAPSSAGAACVHRPTACESGGPELGAGPANLFGHVTR